nr:inositol 2-dehydrogenase [Flaviflexus huanghaiensis]
MANDVIKIGIIGAGRIAHVHARSVLHHPNTELAAVMEPSLSSATAFTQAYGGRPTESIDDLLDEVDAVIVCSPTAYHPEHIVAAARRGRPVLCEKPVAADLGHVDALEAELAGLDATVMIGFNRRFDPSFARLHHLVEAGVIGDVEQVTIISRDPAPPPMDYIPTSGGIFKDMTIHDFDMARHFLGDIVSVVAIGQNLDPALEQTGDFDGAIVTLVNSEGRTATITNSRHCAAGYDQRLEVFGSNGTLNADNVRPTTVRVSTADSTDAQDPYLDFFLSRYEDAYRRELDEFLLALAEGRTPDPTIEDGRRALEIAEAADRSARTGTIISL